MQRGARMFCAGEGAYIGSTGTRGRAYLLRQDAVPAGVPWRGVPRVLMARPVGDSSPLAPSMPQC